MKTQVVNHQKNKLFWRMNWFASSAALLLLFCCAANAAGQSRDSCDFDGDHKRDLVSWPVDGGGFWSVFLSSTKYYTSMGVQWGTKGDIIVPADYDGDGKADFAVYRPSEGNWYVLLSSTGYNPDPSKTLIKQWGIAQGTSSCGFGCGQAGPVYQDFPALGDYDGDGKTDFAVVSYPTSNATVGVDPVYWSVLLSSTGYDRNKPLIQKWGTAGDTIVNRIPGSKLDFDRDGKADFAVYRPSEGKWYVLLSSTGYDVNNPLKDVNGSIPQWGSPGDVITAFDYDGDGKTDLGVWRQQGQLASDQGMWYVLLSSTGYNPDPSKTLTRQWGTTGDVPLPGDYDGDGKDDFAVYRHSDGNLYVLLSSTGYNPDPSKTLITPWNYGGVWAYTCG